MAELTKHLLLPLLLLFMVSCAPDAERDNPLDPNGVNFSPNAVSGTVYTYYPPYLPLTDALVTLDPGGYFVYSDEKGTFRFEKVPPAQYTLRAVKNGFSRDSTQIRIASWADNRVCDLHLNGLPYISEVQLFSEHIDQWWPGEIYRFLADITVDDPDGTHDIDSLRLFIPDIPLLKNFSPTANPGHFHLNIEDFELNQINFFDLVGMPCRLQIRDHPGSMVEFGPYYFHRIIPDCAVPVAPADFQVVSPTPAFTWNPAPIEFDYTHYIEIYITTHSGSIMIDRIDHIPAGTSSWGYTKSLGPGTYFWTIGIEDSLGNRSRSKEASFIIMD